MQVIFESKAEKKNLLAKIVQIQILKYIKKLENLGNLRDIRKNLEW